MDKLNIEYRLSRLVFGLWPCAIDKMVYKNDQEYPLLVAEAEKTGLKPKCSAAFFYLRIEYALKGFEARDGGWKAVFVPFVQTCRLCNGIKNVSLDIVSEDTISALLPFLSMNAEECVDIPRVEQLPLPIITSQGNIFEGEEKYWRIADKK